MKFYSHEMKSLTGRFRRVSCRHITIHDVKKEKKERERERETGRLLLSNYQLIMKRTQIKILFQTKEDFIARLNEIVRKQFEPGRTNNLKAGYELKLIFYTKL